MAELIAIGTTDVNSADFTLTNGDTASLSLKAATAVLPEGEARILLKTSNSLYVDIGKLDKNQPLLVLTAPGTFQVLRRACVTGIGVDKV